MASAGATVRFDPAAPPAGTLVKVRVRGEALTRLLAPGSSWELLSGTAPVPARLVMPQAPDPAEHALLNIAKRTPLPDGRLEVLLDRGTQPPALNRLQPLFSGNQVLASVRVDASLDGVSFASAGQEQLVYLALRDSELLLLCDIECTIQQQRYVRLTFSGLAGATVERIEAWLQPPATAETYEVAAALGAMQPTALAGEHLWPVVLPDDRLPLSSIDVLANAPSQVRAIRVVRLDQALAPVRAEQLAVWADSLQLGALTRSANSVQLRATSDLQPWGIAVKDGTLPTLQLTAVRAHVAEVWLCFASVGAQPVVLWFSEVSQPVSAAALNPQQAVAVGEVSALDVYASPPRPAQTGTLPQLPPSLLAWWRFDAYVASGCIALLLGLLLLQRRKCEPAE